MYQSRALHHVLVPQEKFQRIFFSYSFPNLVCSVLQVVDLSHLSFVKVIWMCSLTTTAVNTGEPPSTATTISVSKMLVTEFTVLVM